MLSILLLLLLLAAPALAGDRIGDIEFFGYKGLDAAKVRAALPVREGDADSDQTERLVRQAVAEAIGKEPTDVALIFCDVHFHFTPTYSSWLYQVECWFSILSRQALRGASFTSPRQLRQAIDDFVSVSNENAAPFEWKKAVVFPSAPKRKYSDSCK